MPITEDIKEEILRLETAIVEDPESMEYFPLAELYRGVSELHRALKICQDGLARHPNNSEGLVILGKILMDMGDIAGAKEALSKAREIYADNDPQVLLLLGQLYLTSGDLAALEKIMMTLKSRFPADVRVNKFWAFLSQQGIVARDGAEAARPQIQERIEAIENEPEVISEKAVAPVHEPKRRKVEKPIISLEYEKLLKLITQIKAFPGVIHVVLLNNDGRMLVSTGCPSYFSNAMGSMLKTFKRALRVAFKSLEFGSWQRGVVEIELLTVHIVEIQNSYLAIICEPKVSMGALRVALDIIIKKVLSLEG